MEFTVLKSSLQRALSVVQNVAQKKSTRPVMANLLVEATADKLVLAGSDLEVSAFASCPATVRAEGKTTVPSKMLVDVVRELPDGELRFSLGEGERLGISVDRVRMRVVGTPAFEYPDLPGRPSDRLTVVDRPDFEAMIGKVIYAASTDETRHSLNGVLFEKRDDGCLRMVATDGHRLAMVTRPAQGIELPRSVLVPRRGLQELRRVLENGAEPDIRLGVAEGSLYCETSDAAFVMKLVEGEFPDYSQVLVSGPTGTAEVPVLAFVQALRRVSLVLGDRGKAVRLDFSKDLLRVSVSTADLGESNEELAVRYDGPDTTVGFNARYLLDLLGSSEGEEFLRVDLCGETGPGMFTGTADPSAVAVVMPMRIG